MVEGTTFAFVEILHNTRRLAKDLRAAVVASREAEVKVLAREVDGIVIRGDDPDAPPLSIAFVGQYDAGKSTILKALTGRDDIVIDSNVSTSVVTPYDWNGVQVLDTPGVKSGQREHDEKTEAAVLHSDLLVFVITNELFDNTIGCHFRKLAFERQHETRMLLVVNKMAQDTGAPYTKLGDIAKVTKPRAPDEFGTVFIDAQCWLEAQDEDGQDRADLLEIANLNALVEALNRFVAQRGLAGRLAAPLAAMQAVAEQAHALLSTDVPEQRVALELLHRKRNILQASQSRLRTAMNGLVGRAVTDVNGYGHSVAEAIEPESSQAQVQALHEDAVRKAERRTDELSRQALQCVQREVAEVERELDALGQGSLARELRLQLEPGKPSWVGHKDRAAEWPAQAMKIGKVANGIGKWAARWATGSAAKTAGAGTATAARSSQAHKVIYDAGKFFGVKFKPWGAVKIAKTIGNAGRVLAAVAGVLAVAAQIMEDREQDRLRRELRQARDGIRSAYRDCAQSIEDDFRNQLDALLADLHGSEMAAIQEQVQQLTGTHAQRSAEVDTLLQLQATAKRLIGCLNQAARSTAPPSAS
ncbi:MAG: GTPase domain-containing protein [Pseudomonadota bacterium]